MKSLLQLAAYFEDAATHGMTASYTDETKLKNVENINSMQDPPAAE